MTVVFLIPVIIILPCIRFTSFHGYKQVIILGGIYSIIYCIISYKFVMNTYEREIVDKVLCKIKLKKV